MAEGKLIPKESLTAFERWELPNMGGTPAPEPEPEVEELDESDAPQPLTAEQIEAIQQEAYREGFEQGRREGLESGTAEVRANALRLQHIFKSLAEPLAELDERVENELLELAVAVARQVIYRELQTDPGHIVGVIREAMKLLPTHQQEIRILLHPEDAKLLREKLPMAADGEQSWRLVEDPVLTRGGCRVVTENAQIDATVEKRLNTTVAELFGGRRQGERPE